MGPTDWPEPAAGDESSAVVSDTDEHSEESSADANADETATRVQRRLDEGADAEAEEMAARMQRRVEALPGKAHESEPFTIFRVAGPMRGRNRHLYEPQMVSVGPFHRGAARLRAMEEHKSILFLCLKVLLLETFEGEEDEVLEYHLMVLV
ncbi:hypothetical protein OsI_30069 [Oryza sativa Indica Group]|uniref:Uncharacterized protein n=1 Tax=Oryza sativa subsp. indica TaxID=39946 RepID=A2YXK0_ORYSI|nr:hypothetical protein OsI_30069 [Oryza sativa Indica Group]